MGNSIVMKCEEKGVFGLEQIKKNAVFHDIEEGEKEEYLVFHGEDSYLSLENPYPSSAAMGIYLKVVLTYDQMLDKGTKEFVNSTNGTPESGALWGYSLNYDPQRGIWLALNSQEGTKVLNTKKILEADVPYELFVYWDVQTIQIYVDGKRVGKEVNTINYHSDMNFILIGAGVLLDSFVSMKLYDLQIFPRLLETDREIRETALSFRRSVPLEKQTSVIALHKPERHFFSASLVSYSLAGLSFLMMPVSFGLYGYYADCYNNLEKRYHNAGIQEESDIYHRQMIQHSFSANSFLCVGIAMIPISILSLTAGIIFTMIYSELKAKNVPMVALDYSPWEEKCSLFFRISL